MGEGWGAALVKEISFQELYSCCLPSSVHVMGSAGFTGRAPIICGNEEWKEGHTKAAVCGPREGRSHSHVRFIRSPN